MNILMGSIEIIYLSRISDCSIRVFLLMDMENTTCSSTNHLGVNTSLILLVVGVGWLNVNQLQ